MAEPTQPLFTAIDAEDVESRVLGALRRQCLEDEVPSFDPKQLGFPVRKIAKVAADAAPEVLRGLAAQALEQLSTLRHSGEKSLAVLDRQRLKHQILRALVRQRLGAEEDDDAAAAPAGTGIAAGAAAAEHEGSDDAAAAAAVAAAEDRDDREEAIRMGLMTPLDAQVSMLSRPRMSMMQHKLSGASNLAPPGRRPDGRPWRVGGADDDWTSTWRPPKTPRRSPPASTSAEAAAAADAAEAAAAASSGRKRSRQQVPASNRRGSKGEEGDGAEGGEDKRRKRKHREPLAAAAAAKVEDGEDLDPASGGRRRRRRRYDGGSGDDEGTGNDAAADVTAAAATAAAGIQVPSGGPQQLKSKGKGKRAAAVVTTDVECPVCGVGVAVTDPARPDAAIGAHLDRCLGRPQRRRRAAASPVPAAVGGDSEEEDNLAGSTASAAAAAAALSKNSTSGEEGGASGGSDVDEQWEVDEEEDNGTADDSLGGSSGSEEECEGGGKRPDERRRQRTRPSRGRLRGVDSGHRRKQSARPVGEGEDGAVSAGQLEAEEGNAPLPPMKGKGKGSASPVAVGGVRMRSRAQAQGGLVDDYYDRDYDARMVQVIARELLAREEEKVEDSDEIDYSKAGDVGGGGGGHGYGGGSEEAGNGADGGSDLIVNGGSGTAAAPHSGRAFGGGAGGAAAGNSGCSSADGGGGSRSAAAISGHSAANGANNGGGGASRPDIEVVPGLRLARHVTGNLFQYQLTGLRWMWQLHQQGAGGIVGDEMGLGKTVQVAAFLGALHRGHRLRSAIIVAPATMLAHWQKELHAWAPLVRVVVLHRSAVAFNAAATAGSERLGAFVRRTIRLAPAVVAVTSYEGAKALREQLLPHAWDYAVLDEGQKIRNPDADVTLLCKQLRTVHRLVVTGTPIQNNLLELWSLFDFVFPGRLATLPAFDAEFATPIRVGGYANASPHQAQLAYRCAVVLRDLIDPYLLRRQKKDIQEVLKLPKKTEQVLFCRLTPFQRRLYADFLTSSEVQRVLSRDMRCFRAIGILRKLCNHADLVCRPGDSLALKSPFEPGGGVGDSDDEGDEEGAIASRASRSLAVPKDALGPDWESYGAPERSGKLLVLQQLLPMWEREGHRVLIFSQTRIMLDIIEIFVKSRSWSYGRLDGSTPVGTRQGLIDRFNGDESVFLMLLTTRTGGVGTNLTGADRVVLFDPDWNPSTDAQARERAWRLGQLRPVTVYRLITAGTIEEKIYHRQIFKTALTNRVLKDPKQKRLFSSSELRELFTLGSDGAAEGPTETADLFKGEGDIDVDGGGSGGDSDSRNGRDRRKRRNGGRESSHQRRRGEGGGGRDGSRLRFGPRSPQVKDGASREDGGVDGAEDGGSGGGRRPPMTAAEEAAVAAVAAVAALEAAAGTGGRAFAEEGDREDGGAEAEPESSATSRVESEVLRALFDGGPLTGVFAHDLAEGGEAKKKQRRGIEAAAEAAAQRALERLKRSRAALSAEISRGGDRFVPTWTGRSGVGSSGDAAAASAPAVPLRFGNVVNAAIGGGGGSSSAGGAGIAVRAGGAPSSSELLQRIQERRRRQVQETQLFPELSSAPGSDGGGSRGGTSSGGGSRGGAGSGAGGGSSSRDDYYAALLERLHGFFREHSRGAQTEEVLRHFRDVPDADAAVFRQLLRAMAVRREGFWSLRDDVATLL